MKHILLQSIAAWLLFGSPATAFVPSMGWGIPNRSVRHLSKEMDVSDLGLTLEDLNKPLPKELLQGISRTGYESTCRIPSVDDTGCEWIESGDQVVVKLQIAGLRGQPSAATSVLFSTTTISVSVFGRVVWSAILRGTIKPEECKFETEDGTDMVPVIRLSVTKVDATELWGGFILQVGEDSLV